jgi:ABC-type dipeptide/oligopeptide/nickel transport system permease component
VTVLGPITAFLVTGSFVTEQIFAVPGIGRAYVQSIGNRDYTLIMGTTLLFAFALVLANTIVDISYGWLDPRIRYD